LGTENFVFFGCGGVLSSFLGVGGVQDCGVEAWVLGVGVGVGFDGGGDGG